MASAGAENTNGRLTLKVLGAHKMADDSVPETHDIVYTLFGTEVVQRPRKNRPRVSELMAVTVTPMAPEADPEIYGSSNFKLCPLCNRKRRLEAFPADPRYKLGVQTYCKECMAENSRGRYRSPKKKRSEAMRHKFDTYGITEDAYEAMVMEQDGKCAICCDALDMGKMTHIDHCHTTGKIRGILCMICNWCIGAVETKPQRLSGFAAYLEKHKDDF